MKRAALATAGTIFLLVALLQLARIYLKFNVVVDGTLVPIGADVVALVITAALSFWMFYAMKSKD